MKPLAAPCSPPDAQSTWPHFWPPHHSLNAAGEPPTAPPSLPARLLSVKGAEQEGFEAALSPEGSGGDKHSFSLSQPVPGQR